MKIFRKSAEFVGYIIHNGKRINEWRCPNCGFGVEEGRVKCCYCGQRIKYEKPEPAKMLEITFKVGRSGIQEGGKIMNKLSKHIACLERDRKCQ